MSEATSSEDWGNSDGARLAQTREANSLKRFERRFQLLVLLLLSAFSLILVAIDAWRGTSFTKDVLVVVLPLFSFVLGRLEARDQ